jgi:hypothetical protein
MLFLTILSASLLGTFLGNFGLFYLIGQQARKAEKAQLAELQQLQQGYLDMVHRERKRMENYAKMES